METTYSPAEVNRILTDLSVPFALFDVKWRVDATSRDGRKGFAVPYADPRAYIQRLNDHVTSAGWEDKYEHQTIAGVERLIDGRVIQTVKLITRATLTIAGIGTKSSTGETWADEEYAATGGEAQAFKRAAAKFGLGKYLYDIKDGVDGVNLWVPIDDRGVPMQVPRLPYWALRPEDQKYALKPQAQGPGPQRRQPTTAPALDTKKYIAVLGLALFTSIKEQIDLLANAGQLQGDKSVILEKTLNAKVDLLKQVSEKAADLSLRELDELFKCYNITRLNEISHYTVLEQFAKALDLWSRKAA